jgi:adenosylmethionine-8-amino-7-oxononanoate aminotransferase
VHKLAALDHQYVWHPFTQMQDWLKEEPIVIKSGSGAVLRDVYGKEYLDANSSIWTNLHGHNHPVLNSAITGQLSKIAHSSALGLASGPASLLGEKLVKAAQLPRPSGKVPLAKVFYSDDGSTAMEAALKLSYAHTRRTSSLAPRFLTLEGSYHGDTVGAVSLGRIDLFHKAYADLLFQTDPVMTPYCYRCPFNRAAPERTDARKWRKCNWECVDAVAGKMEALTEAGTPATALALEPMMQGAAGMIPQPKGWLGKIEELASAFNIQLILDEVMTGFGRVNYSHEGEAPSLFAFQAEGVQPDFVAVAKGLTGGYLPMGATLATQTVFNSFLGEYQEFKTFFHGHSYTGNQLGSAAALASLDLLNSDDSVASRKSLAMELASQLNQLWRFPVVGDIRQAGLTAGIELVRDWKTREPFRLEEQAGIRVCRAMKERGVLTRPIGNVIVLMPPFCSAPRQIATMVQALGESIQQVLLNGGR